MYPVVFSDALRVKIRDDAIVRKEVIWTAETLDEFLTNPNAKVPGTAMIGILPDPQERADVIAYLATLKN